MIPEDELMRLRDFAFEYLPAARIKQCAKKTSGHEDYYLTLFDTATTIINRNLSAIELAAARLLQAISLHATADDSDIEIYQSTIYSIEKAINKLSKLTGRTIKLAQAVEEDDNELTINSRWDLSQEITDFIGNNNYLSPTALNKFLIDPMVGNTCNRWKHC